MANRCKDCKVILNRENIRDKKEYIKWVLKNHPDKFRAVGGEAFKNAEDKFKEVEPCYKDWYGDDPFCYEHPDDMRTPTGFHMGRMPTPRMPTPRMPTPRKSTSRKSTKRKSTKRKSTKRKSTKRKSTKRKSTKRKSTKRKSTKRKSTKRKSTKRKSKARKSRRPYVSKTPKKLGECRGRSKKSCGTDPNCSYRKSVGCVRRRIPKGRKRRPVYYGPAMN